MRWMDWPSWLRGGVIGLAIFILIIFVFYLVVIIIDPHGESSPFLALAFIFNFFMIYPATFLNIPLAVNNSHLADILITILNAAVYFIIGAIIGCVGTG